MDTKAVAQFLSTAERESSVDSASEANMMLHARALLNLSELCLTRMFVMVKDFSSPSPVLQTISHGLLLW